MADNIMETIKIQYLNDEINFIDEEPILNYSLTRQDEEEGNE